MTRDYISRNYLNVLAIYFPIPILMEFSKVGKCKACTLIRRQLVLPVSFIEVFSTVLGAAPTIPIE